MTLSMMDLLLKPILLPGNALVRWLLRSRLHWLLSGQVVLLEVRGRRSGRVYLVPVNYRPTEYGIAVMTYRGRKWWRNLRGVDRMFIYLRGKRVEVRPELVLDDLDAIAQGLVERGWVRKAVANAKAEESVLIRLWLV